MFVDVGSMTVSKGRSIGVLKLQESSKPQKRQCLLNSRPIASGGVRSTLASLAGAAF